MDKKTRHEQFVTGFTGGSIAEIYAISGICVLSMVTHHYVSQLMEDAPSRYLCDFIFNWVTVLASVTYYANNMWLLTAVLSLTLGVSVVLIKKQSREPEKSQKPIRTKISNKKGPVKKESRSKQDVGAVHRPFITVYRSAMMVLTMTAILAVDFSVFPRRFAKTETWGTSLMDLGVGSFVFSLGIVSARKELKAGAQTTPFSTELFQSIHQTLKVLALGLIRLISVKSLDYQEHVSEYGVHWNFFFTLGFLPCTFVFVRKFPLKLSYTTKGAIIALAHELLLKNTGLMEWALIAPRVSIISQNKEGIVSFVGYLAIFTFGYSLGMQILSSSVSMGQIIKKTALYAIIAQILYQIFTISTQSSRRLANLPYILWVLAFNSGLVAILAIAERYIGILPSPSYSNINKYGETMFVTANLATGIVNMCFDTVLLGRGASIAVLVAYLLALMTFAHLKVRYSS